MARVEDVIEHIMAALEDRELYRAIKESARINRSAGTFKLSSSRTSRRTTFRPRATKHSYAPWPLPAGIQPLLEMCDPGPRHVRDRDACRKRE
jgi:hypothetical protein